MRGLSVWEVFPNFTVLLASNASLPPAPVRRHSRFSPCSAKRVRYSSDRRDCMAFSERMRAAPGAMPDVYASSFQSAWRRPQKNTARRARQQRGEMRLRDFPDYSQSNVAQPRTCHRGWRTYSSVSMPHSEYYMAVAENCPYVLPSSATFALR